MDFGREIPTHLTPDTGGSHNRLRATQITTHREVWATTPQGNGLTPTPQGRGGREIAPSRKI